MKATVNVDGLHRLSSFHRRAIMQATRIGCFCCTEFSKPSQIKEWIDVRKVRKGREKLRGPITLKKLMKLPEISQGQTAMCPRCGIDSVLPDRTFGFRLTNALLVAMERRWFGRARDKGPLTCR